MSDASYFDTSNNLKRLNPALAPGGAEVFEARSDMR
jgi:hypothetical protein